MYNINELSGWYYDLQLNNRLVCATLHPNKIPNGNNWDDPTTTDDDNPEYAAKPICKAIVTEDFNVAVANSWSDFGGDMLGQIWESVKPLAPYADSFKKGINNAVTRYKEMLNSNKSEDKNRLSKIKESDVSKAMANAMIWLDEKLNKPGGIDITDYLNRSLVVQGTRFSYYSGSGTSFGNLMMKFTLFPTYDGTKFITVDEQVKDILPYCIGKFVSGTEGLLSDEERQKEGSVAKLVDDMISWQKPPGGFKANVKNVDIVQEGTLLLKFGAYYMIENLVIENATFNFSKQMTKNPGGYKSGNSIISPLYCDVTIQLRPATKYSDVSLRKFVFGNDRASRKTITAVNDTLRLGVNMNAAGAVNTNALNSLNSQIQTPTNNGVGNYVY